MPGRIKANQIPDGVLRELKGLPKRRKEKTTTWADIPASWVRCEQHGWASSAGLCPWCEDGEGDMYIQLDADYYGHPKTLHLISLLGQEADTYPPRLWTWAAKYAKDGLMRSASMIETACRWTGQPGELADALVTAGFVDADLRIHNWMSRTGRDIESYEKKKGRLREIYRNSSGRIPEDCRNSAAIEERRGEERRVTEQEKPYTGPGSVVGHLMRLARKAKIPGRPETIRSYIEAWMARSDAGRVEQLLMDPWTPGHTVIEIQERFYASAGGSEGSWKDLIRGGGK